MEARNSSKDECDRRGFTALHFAAYYGNPVLIELLFNAGANAYATN